MAKTVFESWRVCSKVWMGFLMPVVLMYVLAHFYRMLKTNGEKSPRVSQILKPLPNLNTF